MKSAECNNFIVLFGTELFELRKSGCILIISGIRILPAPLPCHCIVITAEKDVGTASLHVGGDGNHPLASGLSDNFSLFFVLLGVENIVRNTLFLQEFGKDFGFFDRNRTDKHRLALRMELLYLVYNSRELLLLGLVDDIREIRTQERPVRRDYDYFEVVALVELLGLGIGCSGHAGELCIHTEIILERDGGQGLVLILDDHPLFCLYRLVQAVRPAAPRHQTPGEFVDNHHLAVLDDIVDIALVHGMRPQSLIDMVEHDHVAGVVEIIDLQKSFNRRDSFFRKSGGLCLLIHGEIAGVSLPLSGKGICLDLLDLPFLEFGDDPVDDVILVRRLLGRARADQRRTRFVNKDGVHLIDYGKIERTLYVIFQGELHVVAEIVETELVVSSVGYVGSVGLPPLVVIKSVDDHSDGEAEKLVQSSHPLGVTLSEIIVYRYNMNPFTADPVQIGGKCCNQGLPLAGLHL